MRSSLNILLAALLILPVLAGGLWWWSIQPSQLTLTEQQHQTLRTPQGIHLQLTSDPELIQTEIEWHWLVGTATDTDDLLGRHSLFLQGLTSGQFTEALPSLASCGAGSLGCLFHPFRPWAHSDTTVCLAGSNGKDIIPLG